MNELGILYESVDELVPYDMISEYNSPFLATEGIISKIQSKWDDMILKLNGLGDQCAPVVDYVETARTACRILRQHENGKLAINKSTADKMKNILNTLSLFVKAVGLGLGAGALVAGALAVLSGIGTIPAVIAAALAGSFIGIIVGICEVMMSYDYYFTAYENEKKYMDQTIANLEEVVKKSKNPKLRKQAANCLKTLKKAKKEIESNEKMQDEDKKSKKTKKDDEESI